MTNENATVQSQSAAGFGLLASALAGRDLRVAISDADTLAWTDGVTIFVPSVASRKMQVRMLCLQSALIAAGSLNHALLREMARRPGLAERYLCLEGYRALAELRNVLPPSLEQSANEAVALLSGSAQQSLVIARSEQLLEPAPAWFGRIDVKELLRARCVEGGAASAGQHLPREQAREALKEFVDDPGQDDDTGEDFASSPIGGGGGIGKLLQKLFQMARRLKGGGEPGADATTHWMRSGSRAGARTVRSSARPETIDDAFGKNTAILYPEWNVHQGAYRMDWCSVKEIEASAEVQASVEWLQGYGLRKPLSRLGMELDRFHRQRQGDDIDIDAAIEAEVEMAAGLSPDESIYLETQRHRRDLSVLVLLDVSGSVAQASVSGHSVHELQRGVAASLVTVLYEVGDRVALYAFHSQGRALVHLVPLKRFDESLDSRVMNRLYSLKPGAYSRLGAAIRHGATQLIEQGGTTRKLLVVLSDGLAYDHGYEPGYAAADVRQSLGEARREGVACLCLSVGADTATEDLRKVFGSAAHAMVPEPRQLGQIIGPLFRAALQAAEMQRRVA